MSLATLSIDLTAQLAKLEAGMDKAVRLAEKDSARMERAFSRVAGVAAGIGGAIAAAVSVREITDWIKGSIDAADAAAKQARTVGLLTEEITALNYAADLSGVSQDELTTALVKLSKTAKDAGDGVKASAESFAQLGVNVKKSDGSLKSSSELLDEIADRFQALPDGVNKTALATELFGRAGAKMISLLNGGSQGLADFRREAEQLGLVIGTDVAQNAEKLNDNIARLQKNMVGLGNSIAASVLPVLNDLVDRVLAAQKTFSSFGEFIRLSISGKAFTEASQGVDYYTSRVSDLSAELARLKASGGLIESLKISGAQKDLADAQKLLEFYQRAASAGGTLGAGGGRGSIVPPFAVKAQTTINAIPEAAKKGAKEKAEEFGPLIPPGTAAALKSLEQTDTAKITELRDRLAALLNLQSAGIQPEATAEAIRKTREELDKFDPLAQSAAKRLEELQQAGAASFEATRTPAERLNAELAKQNAILEALGPAYRDTYERAVFAAQDAYDEAVKVNKELDKTNDFAKQVGLTFTSAFEDAIVGGKGLRDVLKGIEQDLLRIFTRKLVTEPLGKAITGFIGGGFDFGKILGSLFGGLPSFDVGTPYVPRDMVAMVHKGERIVPAAQNAAGGGGMRVTNVFHLSGQVDRRTQQQIAAAAARGVEAASRRLN